MSQPVHFLTRAKSKNCRLLANMLICYGYGHILTADRTVSGEAEISIRVDIVTGPNMMCGESWDWDCACEISLSIFDQLCELDHIRKCAWLLL
jgi:hypothetical protein